MAVSGEVGNGRAAILNALLVDTLARLDACEDDRSAKALSVEAREIMAELDELQPPQQQKPKTALDELRKRREAKKSA